jgi:large subunit ribosomal protein L23
MKTLFLQPLITEKSMLKTSENIYSFIVPTWANKNQIARLVEQNFKVSVDRVTTSTMQGERVRFKAKPGQHATVKKALVRLAKGSTIAEFSLPAETAQHDHKEHAHEAPEATPATSEKTESTVTVRTRGKKAEKSGGEK